MFLVRSLSCTVIGRAVLLLLLLLLLPGGTAMAYRLKCNGAQTRCEVVTKRLVKGDRIGIFNDSKVIIAVGTVTKVSGKVRRIRIDKKFGAIAKDDEALLIKDHEARNPKKYFNYARDPVQKPYGASLGITSLGVGEGIQAMDLQGLAQFPWEGHRLLVARLMYLMGSGTAQTTGDELVQENVGMSAIGASGGVAWLLLPRQDISIRAEAGLGFANVSLNTSGEADAKELLDGRLFPGMGVVLRAEIAVIMRLSGLTPYAGANFLRLQNSNDTGVHAGLLFKF